MTVARSTDIKGPYEGCKSNPILTHRHLGNKHPVTNVGHADIVQTQDGEWWMVCLGSRPYGGYYRNLGRETFLVPFVWEEGWPVVNPGKGVVELEMQRPSLPEHRWPSQPVCDHFGSEQLGLTWNFIRTPRGEFWSLTERPGYLRLKLKPETMTEFVNPSFVGRRQQHIQFSARTVLEFAPQSVHEVAGLVILQHNDAQYRAEYTRNEQGSIVRLVRHFEGMSTTLAEQLVGSTESNRKLYLKVEARGQDYSFYFATQAEVWNPLLEHVDGTILSVDVAGGFSGTYIGLFASSQGQPSQNHVDFDYFEYSPLY